MIEALKAALNKTVETILSLTATSEKHTEAITVLTERLDRQQKQIHKLQNELGVQRTDEDMTDPYVVQGEKTLISHVEAKHVKHVLELANALPKMKVDFIGEGIGRMVSFTHRYKSEMGKLRKWLLANNIDFTTADGEGAQGEVELNTYVVYSKLLVPKKDLKNPTIVLAVDSDKLMAELLALNPKMSAFDLCAVIKSVEIKDA